MCIARRTSSCYSLVHLVLRAGSVCGKRRMKFGQRVTDKACPEQLLVKCNACSCYKPHNAFYLCYLEGRDYKCSDCARQTSKARRERENPHVLRILQKTRRLQKKQGVPGHIDVKTVRDILAASGALAHDRIVALRRVCPLQPLSPANVALVVCEPPTAPATPVARPRRPKVKIAI